MDQLGSPYVDHLDPICVVDRAELEEKKGRKNEYKTSFKTFFNFSCMFLNPNNFL